MLIFVAACCCTENGDKKGSCADTLVPYDVGSHVDVIEGSAETVRAIAD